MSGLFSDILNTASGLAGQATDIARENPDLVAVGAGTALGGPMGGALIQAGMNKSSQQTLPPLENVQQVQTTQDQKGMGMLGNPMVLGVGAIILFMVLNNKGKGKV